MNSTESIQANENNNRCSRHFGKMTPSKIFRIIGWVVAGLSLACFFALIFGFLVKWLWAVTLSPLFDLPLISYWQAVGLIILSRLLFGGFGHHKNGNHPPFHRKMNGCFFGDDPEGPEKI